MFIIKNINIQLWAKNHCYTFVGTLKIISYWIIILNIFNEKFARVDKGLQRVQEGTSRFLNGFKASLMDPEREKKREKEAEREWEREKEIEKERERMR